MLGDLSSATIPPLIIVGMHRSGTSLIAQWLARCGLHIGSELVPASQSNPKGHFEDAEISAFHRDILKRNGLTYLVCGNTQVHYSQADYIAAHQLIQARRKYQQWGWKEPRTCLMLSFWREVIPEAKYLIVYRHYAQVVDSLIRRDRQRPLVQLLGAKGERTMSLAWYPRVQNLKTQYPAISRLYRSLEAFPQQVRSSYFNLYLMSIFVRTWNRYNQDIIAFVERHSDDCIVLALEDLLTVSLQVIEFLNRRWGYMLDLVPAQEVFDARLLTTRTKPVAVFLAKLLDPGVGATLSRLGDLRDQTQQMHLT